MVRFLVLVGVFALPAAANAQAIQRGKIKDIDLDKRTIAIDHDGKVLDLLLTEKTQTLGAKSKDFKERFLPFKPGVEIFFRLDKAKLDGKDVLQAIALTEGKKSPDGPPKVDLAKMKPLTEMGAEEYHGHKGGLYPGGKNERSAEHEAAGLRLAKSIQPLDADGKPSLTGKIVLLSVGMSNTSQMSQGFQKVLAGAKDVNPHFKFVNGAQGGMTAARIQDPDDGASGATYWSVVEKQLKSAGVSSAQVQVVWIKQADAGPSSGFPAYARTLEGELAKIVQLLPKRFPGVKLVYLSSRTFGGYATTRLNPEPYAFESAFSVRWLIERQLKGDAELNHDPAKGAVKSPWLSWGPYLWANGTNKRSDGFYYEKSDFVKDGTHHSPAGQEKTGRLLLEFLKSDTTARPWFWAGK